LSPTKAKENLSAEEGRVLKTISKNSEAKLTRLTGFI